MGIHLYAVSLGRGLPVLFLHGGMGLDHQHFRPGMDTLAAGHRIVYTDLRGQGRSPLPAPDPAWRIDLWVQDLEVLRNALGLDSWIVLGHSAGGLIALEYAHRHPERTRGLVLCATVPCFDFGAELFPRLLAEADERQQAALLTLFATGPANAGELKAAHLEILPLYFHRLLPEHSECFRNRTIYRHEASNGFRSEVLSSFDSRPWLSALTMPVLVIEAEHDRFIPTRYAGEVFEHLIPDVRRVRIPDAGHFPFLEQPAAFLDALRGWLGAVFPGNGEGP